MADIKDKRGFLELALARWKQADTAEGDNRQEFLDDLRFRAGDQWPDDVRNTRSLDSRPCLTFNRLPQFIRQVTNDERQNRPSIKVVPSKDGSEDTAAVLEGLVRHIQVSSEAEVAYDTACDHQTTIGIGYIRVVTEYESQDSFDQCIKIKRIFNPLSVYFDPSAQEFDYSDANWAFITEDVPQKEFKEMYPDAQTTLEFQGKGDPSREWLANEIVRVAEYFYVEEKRVKIFQLDDGRVLAQEEYEAMQGAGLPLNVRRERETTKRVVKWAKITACDILETAEWAGEYIPIVPVLGEDIIVDGKRRISGIVRFAKDAQRSYNFFRTSQAEAIALAPKSPFVLGEGQAEGYEAQWQTANVRNYSYLTYKPTSINGVPLPPPQRMQAEPPVQAMVQATQMAADDLKATTGIYDAALGNHSQETSGKAILARQRESDVSNFHFIDNLSRSIRHVGRIVLELIPKIYDAPRVIRIVNEDMTNDMVAINQPVDKNGKPLDMRQGNNSPEQDIENTQKNAAVQKIYDTTTGKYDIVVTTGPGYNTKRQEAVQSMAEVTQAYPPLFQVGGDIMVRNMDWPGAEELAERLKKMLPPQLQEGEGDEDIPPAAKAKMAQQQQLIDQLTQALNAASDQKEIEALKMASQERIQNAKLRNDLVIKNFEAHTAANSTMLDKQLTQIDARQAALTATPEQAVEGASAAKPNLQQQPLAQSGVGG